MKVSPSNYFHCVFNYISYIYTGSSKAFSLMFCLLIVILKQNLASQVNVMWFTVFIERLIYQQQKI